MQVTGTVNRAQKQHVATECFCCERRAKYAKMLANNLSPFSPLPLCLLWAGIIQVSLYFLIPFSLGLDLTSSPPCPPPFPYPTSPSLLLSPSTFPPFPPFLSLSHHIVFL